ncbi:hypothetical protein Bpfe_009010 [Biomphalaria pfeifferi]|uniref:Uncharacterized protein n=1 Tax=Biomphalaria pfeifferi TaxID=112525 RepID=A0AAD8BWT6_BIOPF|nr:hypothetical protein Bpfe_009010 [Biomphalaria pfeifferi]
MGVSALVIGLQITNGRLGDKAVLECFLNVSDKPDHLSIMWDKQNYYFECDTNSLPYNCTAYSLAIPGKHERDSSQWNLSPDIFNGNRTTTYILNLFNSGWIGLNITCKLNNSTITIIQQ